MFEVRRSASLSTTGPAVSASVACRRGCVCSNYVEARRCQVLAATNRRPGQVRRSREADELDAYGLDGSMLEQVVGTLGIVETWFLIVYGLTDYAPFTSFEKMIFSVLARFELAGYMAVLYSWFRILRGYGSSTTSFDGKDNSKTLTRDALHNLVYPRSEPGSRIRREFAAIAWVGVLVGGLPVLVVLPLYPVWGTTADTPDYLSLVPLALGVTAIVEVLAGWVYLSTNRSSYVATVLYLNAKVTSLVILVCGYDRLLGGSEWGGNFPTGSFLAVLQVVKISSAVVALAGYIRGRPDEGMPNCNAMCRSCRAFCCK